MKKKILRIIALVLMVIFLAQFKSTPTESLKPIIIALISLCGAMGCFLASYEER